MYKMGNQEKLRCKGCGRVRVRHYANGLCKNCYDGWNRQRVLRDSAEELEKPSPPFRSPFCYACGRRPSGFDAASRAYLCPGCLERGA